jgi:hypothetical protein
MIEFSMSIRENVKGPFRFKYKNHRGEVSMRTAIFYALEYGTTPYHQAMQWFVRAYDCEKKAERTFAIADISEIGEPN